ncbi:MAG: hypothetical protein CME62_05595 [Halobacteriovoraceae bacterium]|nr:hypothetical protein [Halobacteriovoraceae bacterium]|tara:strand:+ start:276 stop:1370 length:1095 start_codon:yes stop_codon:yes gene_type:complete
MIILLICIFIPFLMLTLEKRFKAFNSVIACYALGFALSLQPWLGIDKEWAQKVLGFSIVMAIIFLLMSSDIKAWLKTGKDFIRSALAFFIIVPIMSICFTLILIPEHIEFDKIAAMLTGVYIGSIPNLFALGQALRADLNLIATLQLADIFFSGVFSLIILSPLIKKIYAFLPHLPESHDFSLPEFKSFQFRESFKLCLWALLIFLVGFGINYLGEFQNSQLVILTLVSVLAMVFSYQFKVTAQKELMSIGEYFLLIFCVMIGSQIDFSEIFAQKNFILFILTFSIILTSIIIHMLFCFYLKIPRDIAIITMTAGIYSPAFVPAVAKSLNNKSILIGGMTVGLFGLAMASYIGLVVNLLLTSLF